MHADVHAYVSQAADVFSALDDCAPTAGSGRSSWVPPEGVVRLWSAPWQACGASFRVGLAVREACVEGALITS